MDSGRRRFSYAIGAAVVLVALIAFAVLHRSARAVPVVTVAPAPFTITLPESGVVQYPQIQTMSSLIAGTVGHIFVRAGQRVTAGELLATIDNPEIVSGAQSSAAAYRAATARAASTQVTSSTNVVQAQENVETARARLAQARQDLAGGLQSGLGYGVSTAADQRAAADAALATASTELREAKRVYFAYRDLYGNKAVSRDQLDQAQAKYEQTQAAYRQALVTRNSLGTTIVRSRAVLEDNLRSAQEGYAQALAALSAARVESGGGDVAAASAEAQRAGSDYSFAQLEADATHVRAPYDGIVLGVATEKSDSLRPLQPGDAIGVGQPLVTLAARRAFVVRTRIDEQDVINVALGQHAQITGEDFPRRVLSGHVVEISPIAEKSGEGASRTVATTIAVDNPPAFLRDGISVDVNILTTDLRDAIVVPNDAIERDGAATYVYLVRNGTAYRQPVRVRFANDARCVIDSGLRSGDVIVAQHVAGLRDATPVSISPVPGMPRS